MTHYASRFSLVDSAVNVMRAQIESGRWRVGERIPTEPMLAEMLQVSRGTVREAVKVLVCSGLLEVRQGSGTFLRASCNLDETLGRLKRASLRDHFEVRCSLEAEAARLAARRAGAEEVARLYELLGECGKHPDEGRDAFVQRDLVFHQALVRAAGNPALEELYRWFSNAVRETIAATQETDLPEPDLEAHRAIVEAVAAGDPEGADRAVRSCMAPVLTELDRLLARSSETKEST